MLVSLGSTNMFNVTSTVLQAMQSFDGEGLQIDVILDGQASYMNDVNEKTDAMNKDSPRRGRIHTDVEDMASMMTNADLAIGAGRTTSWERCCLALPTIVVEIADNQKKITKGLADQGAIINMGWYEDFSSDELANTLSDLQDNPGKVMAIAQNAYTVCDGAGTQGVIEEIASVCV